MGDIALLKKAEVLEADRASFYKHSASKVLHPQGKAVLLRLAAAERRHLKILHEQGAFLNNTGDADLSRIEKPAFEELKEEFKESLRANQGDITILEKAVKLERVDGTFYESLSRQTNTRNLKRLFKTLEIEEKKHLSLLNKSLKDLKRKGVVESEARNSRMMFFNFFNRK